MFSIMLKLWRVKKGLMLLGLLNESVPQSHYFEFYIYRPHSGEIMQGDKAVGSVRLSVCLFVCRVQHYQSMVFVCVSVISGCMGIIAWMQSIGFRILLQNFRKIWKSQYPTSKNSYEHWFFYQPTQLEGNDSVPYFKVCLRELISENILCLQGIPPVK